jgi:SAM-dependent methyltransferase
MAHEANHGPSADNIYLQSSRVWEREEAERLKGMDGFLGVITRSDLVPVIEAVKNAERADQVRFLDIAAGTGSTTAELCQSFGVDYTALDANETILRDRTLGSKNVQGKSEQLPFPDGSFDITFSRAATAWNANPQQAILEQLRVTRPGGYAIFTEFDWGLSGTDDIADPIARKLMAARGLMLQVLSHVGFKPEYGEVLGRDIDTLAAQQSRSVDRQETRHELPAGDYRPIFLDSAEVLRKQLAELKPSLATRLQGLMSSVEQAETIDFKLPVVVTQVVRIPENQENSHLLAA